MNIQKVNAKADDAQEANTDGHYLFRPVTDAVTALGSTSVRFEAVNAMILRSYDTSTTSSGVYARIYSNRIYRYSSSSKRYKIDIESLSASDLDHKKLLDVDVVQFKYKPGYLMDGDIHENKDIPGFIVEDLENFAMVKFAEKHLPVKLAFAIAANAEAMNGALKAFETNRIELLKRYADKDEEGNPVIEDDSYKLADVAEYVKELGELAEN